MHKEAGGLRARTCHKYIPVVIIYREWWLKVKDMSQIHTEAGG